MKEVEKNEATIKLEKKPVVRFILKCCYHYKDYKLHEFKKMCIDNECNPKLYENTLTQLEALAEVAAEDLILKYKKDEKSS